MAEEIVGALKAQDVDLELRARPELTIEDLEWADSFSDSALRITPPRALTWVHSMAAGYDRFEGQFAHIGRLTRTIGKMPMRMGRYVAGVVLAEELGLPALERAQAQARWEPALHPAQQLGSALVLGTGPIAAGIADYLDRLDIAVTGINRSGRPAEGFAATAPWEQVGELAPSADVVVNVLPGNGSTAGLIDHSVFSVMRGGHFINVGRGITVDVPDLLAALESGAVGRATLDVFEVEPLPADSPLWTHPGVRLTPHISGPTKASDVVEDLVDSLKAIRAGQRPRREVDLPT